MPFGKYAPLYLLITLFACNGIGNAQQAPADVRSIQFLSIELGVPTWGFWGDRPAKYSTWTNHSNRLIPVYTWGVSLDSIQGENSIYRDEKRLEKLYGAMPKRTLNRTAEYFDQTQIRDLQRQFLNKKKYVFLVVFDGMDWPTTRAAATFNSRKTYEEGRGSGLYFLDYKRAESDFGFMVTSPLNGDTKFDVNTQTVTVPGTIGGSGYDAELGGGHPWGRPASLSYLISKTKDSKHWYTDSASSATSMVSGIKTFNGSINIDGIGKQVRPVTHDFQDNGYAIGVVTSVPISHATPACAYAHNVNRSDYQDITRDILGLPSVAHKSNPLSGVDVLIGCGWGEDRDDERAIQGENYVPGNKYLPAIELEKIDVRNGGRYVVAQRTPGISGKKVLFEGAKNAINNGNRLFGFFGGAHLPFQTADGQYDPTRGASTAERYSAADVNENPTLADMTQAAMHVLSKRSDKGFWLMVEPGDVDWANHNNNLDDSIGAVLSGDAAFKTIVEWVENNSNWDESALILTADHGHLFVLEDHRFLTGEKRIDDIPIVKPADPEAQVDAAKAAEENATPPKTEKDGGETDKGETPPVGDKKKDAKS